jgi:hypothetical protein
MSLEAAQQTLARLFANGETATGKLHGNTFFLRLIPGNRSTEIKIRGRIVRDNGGTLVCAWPCLPWDALIVVAILIGILRHAPIGVFALFIIFFFFGYTFHFTMGTRRGYDFLRKTYAA